MGSFLSSSFQRETTAATRRSSGGSRSTSTSTIPNTVSDLPRKRPRISWNSEEEEEEEEEEKRNVTNTRLIPNLPDEISLQILARLPRIRYLDAKSVSRRWKAAVTSPELYQLRKELRTSEEWLYLLQKDVDDRLLWHAFDPVSTIWQRLPLMPIPLDHELEEERGSGIGIWTLIGSTTIKLGDIVRSWIHRRSDAGGGDGSCVCGCAIGTAGGCVYVLGGFSGSSTMRGVWKYDPRLNSWWPARSMREGRAYCKTALMDGKLYAVGGVSRDRGGLVPLHSAEVYDPATGMWSPLPSMTFANANVLPAALFADVIKPIATGMTFYKGKLCVPQSLYTWPFFVDVGGEVYDPMRNSWDEMPLGMGEGWPARQAGTKLSIVVNGDLYSLDPSSLGGKIKVYDPQQDVWKVAVPKVPFCDFAGRESPYLLAAINGKLHVLTKNAGGNTMIFQADLAGNNACAAAAASSSSTSRPEVAANDKVHSDGGEGGVWKMVAAKNFGASELVSCQVLDI